MNITLRYAARSDRGLVRDGNQDSVYAGPRLLAVADGMGGMAAGDIASTIVIRAMEPLDEDVPGDALVDALRGGVESANEQLRALVTDNPQLEGMGTTLTALLFSGTRAGLVHVGDSRAYLLRGGEVTQITRDDTYVQMLVDEEKLSQEEAGSHPQRSLLTKALDGRDITPEFHVRPVESGDRYLICSDGLSGVVSEETIGTALREQPDPTQCVERLVSLALRGGGPDNVTVIVADATGEDIDESSPMVGGAAAQGVVPDSAGEQTVQLDTGRESTPAARASALAPAPPPPTTPPVLAPAGPEDGPVKRKRPVRTLVVLAVVLVLLSGGLWYGWWLTQSSYYLGEADDGRVAVFQGVPVQVAGLSLSRVLEHGDCQVDEVADEHQQDRIRQGNLRYRDSDEAVETMRGLCAPPKPPDTEDESGITPEQQPQGQAEPGRQEAERSRAEQQEEGREQEGGQLEGGQLEGSPRP